jgi:hypothetical protein
MYAFCWNLHYKEISDFKFKGRVCLTLFLPRLCSVELGQISAVLTKVHVELPYIFYIASTLFMVAGEGFLLCIKRHVSSSNKIIRLTIMDSGRRGVMERRRLSRDCLLFACSVPAQTDRKIVLFPTLTTTAAYVLGIWKTYFSITNLCVTLQWLLIWWRDKREVRLNLGTSNVSPLVMCQYRTYSELLQKLRKTK